MEDDPFALVAHETKTEGGTTFELHRRIHDGYFEKRIEFVDDDGQPQAFTERVPDYVDTYVVLDQFAA